eukprot:14990474-Alexandrium_andersonii.AAC.1
MRGEKAGLDLADVVGEGASELRQEVLDVVLEEHDVAGQGVLDEQRLQVLGAEARCEDLRASRPARLDLDVLLARHLRRAAREQRPVQVRAGPREGEEPDLPWRAPSPCLGGPRPRCICIASWKARAMSNSSSVVSAKRVG